jgi:hypothetical protein
MILDIACFARRRWAAPGLKERLLTTHDPAIRTEVLRTALIAYGVASLLHFGHNAEHLSEYPNLPTWITRADVYSSWLAQTAIGLVGYSLVRGRYPAAGLAGLAAYGLLGLAGLAHYAVAPPSAHTLAMNATIWLEAATALLLLTAVVHCMRRLVRQRPPPARADSG